MPLDCNSPCGGQTVNSNELCNIRYVRGVNEAGCFCYEDAATLFCRIIASVQAGLPPVAIPNGQAGATQLVGTDCRTYRIPAETPLTVVDTASLDLSTSGVAGHTLTGFVRISPAGGNQITVASDGLFVPPFNLCTGLGGVPNAASAVVFGVTRLIGQDCQAYVVNETPLVANDGNTLDFGTAGAFGHTLTGEVRIDPAATNLLTASPSGLLATETTFTPSTTSTINGTPGGTRGHAPIYNVRLSATAGNAITANADGLFVASGGGGAETPFTGIAGNAAIGIIPGGVNGHAPSFSLVPSSTAGNALIVNGTGAYVPNFCTAANTVAATANVPGGATVLYVAADGSCGRAPIGNSETACSLGGLFNFSDPFNNDAFPQIIVLGQASGCLERIEHYFRVNVPGNGSFPTTSGLVGIGQVSTGQSTLTINTSVELRAQVLSAVGTNTGLHLSINPLSGNWNAFVPAAIIAPGNVLGVDAGGNLVRGVAGAAETPLTVIDTPTVNLTATGTANHTLQADVNVSANAGNALSAAANGLFAPDLCASVTALPLADPTIPATATVPYLRTDGSCGRAVIGYGVLVNSPNNTTHIITHNLGVQYPHVTVWDSATNEIVVPDTMTYVDPNTVTVTFAVARAVQVRVSR